MVLLEDVMVYLETREGHEWICVSLGEDPTIMMSTDEAATLVELLKEAIVLASVSSPNQQTPEEGA